MFPKVPPTQKLENDLKNYHLLLRRPSVTSGCHGFPAVSASWDVSMRNSPWSMYSSPSSSLPFLAWETRKIQPAVLIRKNDGKQREGFGQNESQSRPKWSGNILILPEVQQVKKNKSTLHSRLYPIVKPIAWCIFFLSIWPIHQNQGLRIRVKGTIVYPAVCVCACVFPSVLRGQFCNAGRPWSLKP